MNDVPHLRKLRDVISVYKYVPATHSQFMRCLQRNMRPRFYRLSLTESGIDIWVLGKNLATAGKNKASIIRRNGRVERGGGREVEKMEKWGRRRETAWGVRVERDGC
ncbi:hypothetical protein CDAR_98531 [Caerostris darwini]|uniref:Uncharacterized protein n=1 Tax=Caerostris darwini TaxID=1538125 RepID=A0AAV4UFS9_9ARAC|nr:hypothetical protein CDAR_98531 [Caerostris darwini]